MEQFRDFAENDPTVYKHSSLALYFSSKGENEKALEHLKLFSKESNYFYWVVLFLPIGPVFEDIRETPEFKSAIIQTEKNFHQWHQQIEHSLKQKDLI